MPGEAHQRVTFEVSSASGEGLHQDPETLPPHSPGVGRRSAPQLLAPHNVDLLLELLERGADALAHILRGDGRWPAHAPRQGGVLAAGRADAPTFGGSPAAQRTVKVVAPLAVAPLLLAFPRAW